MQDMTGKVKHMTMAKTTKIKDNKNTPTIMDSATVSDATLQPISGKIFLLTIQC